MLAQRVLEHGSATVGFEHYRSVLEAAQSVLPPDVQVTFLADRGLEHGELIRWLTRQNWNWAIRAKSDLQVRLKSGHQSAVAQLLPATGLVHLFHACSGNGRYFLPFSHRSVPQCQGSLGCPNQPSSQ